MSVNASREAFQTLPRNDDEPCSSGSSSISWFAPDAQRGIRTLQNPLHSVAFAIFGATNQSIQLDTGKFDKRQDERNCFANSFRSKSQTM